jgi:chromatin segregation and condensation protein Rec8/ScpA/Scc1 (kleisin family)
MRRAIDSSLRLIDSTRRVVDASEQSAARRPIRTSQALRLASDKLIEASIRLDTAVCIIVKPNHADAAQELLNAETWRWIDAAEQFGRVSLELQEMQERLLESLEKGLVQPERDPATDRRPRIQIVPRTIPARSFLVYRRSTASNRIASVPLRRRPKAPAATGDAPRQISRGRAPPVVSNCLL